MVLRDKFGRFEVPVNIGRFDYASYFEKNGGHKDLPPYLVQYDPESNTVTVDTRAPEEYIRYTALHEAICGGNCGKFCGANLPKPGDENRCQMVEKTILEEVVPVEQQEKYARQRVEMFTALLDMNLNEKANPAFRKSLIYLESWLRKHAGHKHIKAE